MWFNLVVWYNGITYLQKPFDWNGSRELSGTWNWFENDQGISSHLRNVIWCDRRVFFEAKPAKKHGEHSMVKRIKFIGLQPTDLEFDGDHPNESLSGIDWNTATIRRIINLIQGGPLAVINGVVTPYKWPTNKYVTAVISPHFQLVIQGPTGKTSQSPISNQPRRRGATLRRTDVLKSSF